MSSSSRQTVKSTPFRPTNYRARLRKFDSGLAETTSCILESVSSLTLSSDTPDNHRTGKSASTVRGLPTGAAMSPSLPPHMTTEGLDDQATTNAYAARRAMRYIPPSQSEPPQSFVKPTPSIASSDRAKLDPFAKTAILNARVGEASKQDLDDWFADPHTEVFVSEGAIPPRQTSSTQAESPQYTRSEYTGGQQPRFQPGAERCDEMAAKARMLQPVVGGRSKKDQLGSVLDSWGPSEEKFAGMFAIGEDPPSRSTSPFRDEGAGLVMQATVNELSNARDTSLMLARAGTVYEGRRGRPTSGDYSNSPRLRDDEDVWSIADETSTNPGLTVGTRTESSRVDGIPLTARFETHSSQDRFRQDCSSTNLASDVCREKLLAERKRQLQGYRTTLSIRDVERRTTRPLAEDPLKRIGVDR